MSGTISANTQAWLKERFGHQQKVTLSKQTSLTSNQWLSLAKAVREHSQECQEILQSCESPEMGLERLAAVLCLNGVRPVNVEVLKDSTMVQAILKGVENAT